MPKQVQKYVIVGNGFDLNLGIKSSYWDFVQNVKKEHQLETAREVYEFNNLFIQSFDGSRLNWADFETVFENQVLEINSQKFLKEDEARKHFLIDKLNSDLNKLELDFYNYLNWEYPNWLRNQRLSKKKLNPLYSSIFSDAKIISFNFTDSVRDILKNFNTDGSKDLTEQAFYQIHGSLKENNILFGGGFSGTDKVEDISISGSMDNDKLIRIKNNRILAETRRAFREELAQEEGKEIELYILGHSIDGSDLAFMEEMFKQASKIYLFYFGEDYLPKLQSISKKISKEVAEKVFLLPFFEVLIPDNDQLVRLGAADDADSLNLEHIQKFFDFSVPAEEDFQKLTISRNNFVFKEIGNLQIESIREAETLLKFLEPLTPSQLTVKANSYLSISGVEFTKTQALDGGVVTQSVLNQLLDNPVFQKILREVYSLKITKSEFGLGELSQALRGNDLEQLELSDNTIFFEAGQELDLSDFSNSRFLHLRDNIFQTLSDDQLVLPILAGNTKSSRVKNIYLAGNENVEYQTSIYRFAALAKIIHLPYPMLADQEAGDEITSFSEVEQLTLIGEEDAAEFEHIRLNPNVESVTLDNVLFTEEVQLESGAKVAKARPLSDLFEGREAHHLRELNFINCGINIKDYQYKEKNIQIYTDFLNQRIAVRFDGTTYDFKHLLIPGLGAGPGQFSQRRRQEDESQEEEKGLEITMTPEVEQAISSFAQRWYADEEDLRNYVQAIGHSANILEPARKQVIRTTNYALYTDSQNRSLGLMKAKKQFKAVLEQFINNLLGEETEKNEAH